MKGYLFDLDGTLIQSMHVWEDAVMRLFDRLNLKMDIEESRQLSLLRQTLWISKKPKTRFLP